MAAMLTSANRSKSRNKQNDNGCTTTIQIMQPTKISLSLGLLAGLLFFFVRDIRTLREWEWSVGGIDVQQIQQSFLPSAFSSYNSITEFINDDPADSGRTLSSTVLRDNDTNYNRFTDPWTYDRIDRYDSFFNNNTKKLHSPADTDGPILDFLIAGWPKCGTTTLEANLGLYAPMPIADVCTPIHSTMYYAYKNWPKQYNTTTTISSNNETITTFIDKPLRGSKCPKYIENMEEISTYVPKTKIIIGIRHPVLWFQSFWNMLATNMRRYGANEQVFNPYNVTKPCPSAKSSCRGMCNKRNLLCMHRGQFHIGLAKLGKTPLGDDERQLLAPDMWYGGNSFRSHNISNTIYVYEMTQMKRDDFWMDLADFLDIPGPIQHDKYVSSHGKEREWGNTGRINICDEFYDTFRSRMMPISYEVSQWLIQYFLPTTSSRDDVWIHNRTSFLNAIQQYQSDPCQRLVRNETSGMYYAPLQRQLNRIDA